jgi:DNA-binding GntR family transcriptional regulator
MTDAVRLNRVSTGTTLTDRVYVTIKEAILDLTLKPGTPLVEDDLAGQLGTSKTPVRDALLALERDGLVTKIPYKGTYVTEVSVKDATEIFELRAVLEGLAARSAARTLSREDLDRAEAYLKAADEALARGDRLAASAWGAKFHKIIHNHADNRRLLPLLARLEEQLRRLRSLSDQVAGRLDKSAHEHHVVLEALRGGDAEKAEAAMREHLQSVVRDFSVLENEAPGLPISHQEVTP